MSPLARSSPARYNILIELRETLMNMQGKRVLVTGGGQGIGKAIAREFLTAGARVCIVDNDTSAGKGTVNEYAGLGEIYALRGDVGREKDMRLSIRAAARLLGGIDVLVNNAGVFIAPRLSIAALSLKQWERILFVNLTSVFLGAKYAQPFMKDAGGSIINICSTRAFMSEPDTEAYSASKGGIYALTHALAISLGPKIRVNCVSPGWIDVSGWQKIKPRQPEKLRPADHAQHPAGRVGKPEDVAAAVMFLASQESGFITGTNIVVDGGMTRKMIYV
jgi:NAD(P)-dependent dehydrogenase (short-subunit alcohol dehydrogenase family)